MIKNIIFDMGNVLLDFDPEYSLNELCDTEEEKEVVRKELFGGPEWVEGDLGNISDKDRYDLIKNNKLEQKYELLKKE